MPTQYATFLLDDLYLGVPVTAVQEVLRHQEMTPVPLAAREVGGLLNLRGQIVTAVELRRRLGLPERPADRQPMNVVLATAEGPVSLLVDAIDDVVDVDDAAREAPPPTLVASARHLISATYKLPDRLLLVLDTERVLQPWPSSSEAVGPPTWPSCSEAVGPPFDGRRLSAEVSPP